MKNILYFTILLFTFNINAQLIDYELYQVNVDTTSESGGGHELILIDLIYSHNFKIIIWKIYFKCSFRVSSNPGLSFRRFF